MFGFGKKKKDAPVSAPEEKVEEGLGQETGEKASDQVVESNSQAEVDSQATDTEYDIPEFVRDNGPWDSSEVKTGAEYIDLGGLLVKSNPGLNLRLETDQKSGQVIAVTLQLGEGTVQVQAFAAPKSRGIWDDIRKELSESVRRQAGQVDINDGPFGRQLISRVPATLPDGRQGFRIARFVGVDGPRWFVRAVFTGKAVLPSETTTALEEVFRQIVVHRGPDPMAPRDLLPMNVPQNIQEAMAAQQQAAAQEPAGLEIPRRGPEITEIG
ncbi:DUF3710 domain-containing protein [Rothia nasimurium]|uniref:DUF3710 domain-containing protein n=1 Tax=Rothia nasimurium TaxID=85336 RepID=UPI003B9F44B6